MALVPHGCGVGVFPAFMVARSRLGRVLSGTLPAFVNWLIERGKNESNAILSEKELNDGKT